MMEIKEKTVVSLTYDLKVDSGDVVDTANAESPFVFIHGIGSTLAAFDHQLSGLKKGDSFSFSLTPEEGYGEYDATRKIDVPQDAFANAPADFVLEKGKTLPMQDPDGNVMWATITEVKTDGNVGMDLNHPLAGQNLHFAGQIIEIRSATKDELDHGHVHGPDGHNH